MEGLWDFGCRRQLYREIILESVLQTDSNVDEFVGDAAEFLVSTLGTATEVKDTTGVAINGVVLTKSGAKAGRALLGWSKFATFKNVRLQYAKRFDALDTKLGALDKANAGVTIGADLIKLLAFNAAYSGLVLDRLDAFEALARSTSNEAARDGAFLAALDDARAELQRGLNCQGGPWDAALCFEARLESYFKQIKPGVVPLLRDLGIKVVGEKMLAFVFGTGLSAAQRTALLAALSFSIDAYSKDVLLAIVDSLRRGLQANLLVTVPLVDSVPVLVSDESPDLSTELARSRYLGSQTLVYTGQAFYRASARSLSNVDHSLMNQAIYKLLFETKLCFEASLLPPFVALLCPDQDAIQAHQSVISKLESFGAGLLELHGLMGQRLSACVGQNCTAVPGDGVCAPSEIGLSESDCPACIADGHGCDDGDPCTDDYCSTTDGKITSCSFKPGSKSDACAKQQQGSNTCSLVPPIAGYKKDKCLNFGGTNSTFPGQKHVADDVCTPDGTKVRCVADGTVAYASAYKSCPNWGHLILVDHKRPDGTPYCGIYAHSPPLKGIVKGVKLKAGQTIAAVGSYSCWTDHIHFGVRNGPCSEIPCDEGGKWCQAHGYLPASQFPEKYLDPQAFLAGCTPASSGPSPCAGLPSGDYCGSNKQLKDYAGAGTNLVHCQKGKVVGETP
jgi:hypothetical protein